MLLKKYLRKDQKGKMLSQKNLPNLKGQIVWKYHELFLNITLIPKPEKTMQKRKTYATCFMYVSHECKQASEVNINSPITKNLGEMK